MEFEVTISKGIPNRDTGAGLRSKIPPVVRYRCIWLEVLNF